MLLLTYKLLKQLLDGPKRKSAHERAKVRARGNSPVALASTTETPFLLLTSKETSWEEC